jgi:hypothetical protein
MLEHAHQLAPAELEVLPGREGDTFCL